MMRTKIYYKSRTSQTSYHEGMKKQNITPVSSRLVRKNCVNEWKIRVDLSIKISSPPNPVRFSPPPFKIKASVLRLKPFIF